MREWLRKRVQLIEALKGRLNEQEGTTVDRKAFAAFMILAMFGFLAPSRLLATPSRKTCVSNCPPGTGPICSGSGSAPCGPRTGDCLGALVNSDCWCQDCGMGGLSDMVCDCSCYDENSPLGFPQFFDCQHVSGNHPMCGVH